MKKKLCFIVNPVAGISNKKKFVEKIPQILDSKQFDYHIYYSLYAHHASEIVEKNLNNFDAFIAVGGDGTVHDVGKALVGSDKILGIIPAGSANGLAMHIGLPSNLCQALKIINRFHAIKMDTIKVNDDFVLAMAGMGYDAHIAEKALSSKKRGLFNYIKLIFQELLFYQCHHYQLIVDNIVYDNRAFLITFANICQYGGHAVIAPHAKFNDGFLNMIVAKPFPLTAVPKLCYQLMTKSLDQSPFMEMIPCKKVVIKNTSIIKGHLDGDPFTSNTELELTINPLSLNILVP